MHAFPKPSSRALALLAMSTLLTLMPAAAQTPPPAAKACQAAEHRQFDFWVGQWDVFVPSGKKVGENRIELIADGCALLEQWSGSGGVTGKSLNIYDSSDRRWHQTWVDNGGTHLVLAGGLVGTSMVMSATGPSASDPKATVLQRITWAPAADLSVRQHWESSSDGGTTWTTLFDGRYVRAQ